jgi:guanine deaminase
MGLLEWLQHYTFPMEKSLAHDADRAREAYERVVETTLAWGTTAAAYYATTGRTTSEILCDVAENFGQRALVGKVCMNRNSYEGYQETTEESLSETDLFVASTYARKSRLG